MALSLQPRLLSPPASLSSVVHKVRFRTRTEMRTPLTIQCRFSVKVKCEEGGSPQVGVVAVV